MHCLLYFDKSTQKHSFTFNKIGVAIFSEQIAKRAFPNLEFAQMQIRGGVGDIAEVSNDVALEKAWLIYSNLCYIGAEFANFKINVI